MSLRPLNEVNGWMMTLQPNYRALQKEEVEGEGELFIWVSGAHRPRRWLCLVGRSNFGLGDR